MVDGVDDDDELAGWGARISYAELAGARWQDVDFEVGRKPMALCEQVFVGRPVVR